MAQIINVDPEKKDDLYYRYKMPSIVVKKESRGNGVKTVFPNLREVCAKLQRPPELLNKFFGYELGVQSTFVKADDKFLVMGAFTQEHMQEKVYDFIARLVLCKKCRNPETDPRVEKKGGRMLMTCRSCGEDTEVRGTERIFKFMVESYEAIAKEQKKAKKAAEKDKPSKDDDNADANPEAAAAPAVPAGGSTIVTNVAQISARNPVVELADVLRQVPPPSTEKVIQLIMELKTECNVSDAQTIRLVWKAVVEGVDPSKLIGTLQQWVPILHHHAHKDKQYQTLIKEVAKTCLQLQQPQKFPMIMKMLWEEQVLPEEQIKEWVSTYKGKEVKEAAILQRQSAPLMKWLAGEELE